MRLPPVTVLLCFFGASIGTAQTTAMQLAMGDSSYASLDASGALAHYEKAAADSGSYEAWWKASRSAVDIGSYATDATRRTALFTRGEQYARSAVALNPGDAEGHFALARAALARL